jgi:hypothetical protein
MARYAMVHDASGIVVNVIEWDGDTATWQPPAGYTMVEDKDNKAGPGGSYKDGGFAPVPAGVPAEPPPEGGTS